MEASILVIHKSEEDQRAIHQILQSFDFDLTYAHNGPLGIYAAKNMNPDLILSEVELDGMDGIALADNMRKDENLKNIPLVFLHDELDLKLIAAARQVESKAFLIKPYIDNSLIYAVKKALDRIHLNAKRGKVTVPFEKCRLEPGDSRLYA